MFILLLNLVSAAAAPPSCPPPPPCLSVRPGLCADGRACCSTTPTCEGSGQPWCSSSSQRPPLFVTSNPLRGLPRLPKPHYSWPLPGTFLADVAHADGVLVDFGRVTGSLPLDLTYMAAADQGWAMIKTAVQGCHLAMRLQPGTTCTLAVNYSPWLTWPNAGHEPDPTLKGACPSATAATLCPAEAQELHHYTAGLTNVSHWLDLANEELGATVRIGALLIDSEIFESDWWFPPRYKAAVTRKHELIYNASRAHFPDESECSVLFYAYGAVSRSPPSWAGVAPPGADPLREGLPLGWRRDNRFTLDEQLGGSPFTVPLYSVPELQETRDTFRQTVALAARRATGPDPGPTGGLVVPWIALGCGYRRAIANCISRGPECSASFDLTWNYDQVYSWMLGAELNRPYYAAHPDVWAPWDKAPAVLLYPGPFDYRGVVVPGNASAGEAPTTSMMAHFVAYVNGAANLTRGFPGPTMKTDDAIISSSSRAAATSSIHFDPPVLIGQSSESHLWMPQAMISMQFRTTTFVAGSVKRDDDGCHCDPVTFQHCVDNCSAAHTHCNASQSGLCFKACEGGLPLFSLSNGSRYFGRSGPFWNFSRTSGYPYPDLAVPLPPATDHQRYLSFGNEWKRRITTSAASSFAEFEYVGPTPHVFFADASGANVLTGHPAAGTRILLTRLPVACQSISISLGGNTPFVLPTTGELFLLANARVGNDTKASILGLRSRDGFVWNYTGTVTTGSAWPVKWEGPSENDAILLPDGRRIMVVFRVNGNTLPWHADERQQPYYVAVSSDGGATFSQRRAMSAEMLAVRPKLRSIPCKGRTVPVLSGGRPGLWVWVNWKGDGERWSASSVSKTHNSLLPSSLARHRFPRSFGSADTAMNRSLLYGFTTAYTSLVSIGVDCEGMLLYDKLGNGWMGPNQTVGSEDAIFGMKFRLKVDDLALAATSTAAVAGVSSVGCPCQPASLCQPLATPHPIASREVFGAYVHDRTIPHLNYSAITTLFIGPPATLDPAVICAAHAHGVRVVSSVGIPGALLGPPGQFDPAAAATPAARKAWVRRVMYGNGSTSSPGVATTGLDGVLVDIEGYCTHKTSNCTGIDDSKGSLTALIAELAAELKAWHPSSQLSFALSAFPSSQSSFYDHLALSRLLDYIFVMQYDEFPFEAWPKATTVAAANSDLRSLYTTVTSYKTIGVSPSKLVVGLPWYGYDFPCDDTTSGGASSDPPPPEGTPCRSTGAGKTPIKERAVLDQLKDLAKAGAKAPQIFRDNASASLYFDYECTNESRSCPSGQPNTGGVLLGRHQIWCDDADTLRQKYQACRELGVLGVGVYALDFVSYTSDQGAANWAALSAVWPRPPIQPTTASALKSNDDGDAAADVKLSFGAPVVVGSSNRSHFYFPAVAVALGNGRVAQHVTLCDDSASCSGNCAQVWRSTGGGGGKQPPPAFQLVKTVHEGGSGNFNFYGDLGEPLPRAPGSSTTTATASEYVTLVGNNGGSWLGHNVSLQRWANTATSLQIVQIHTAVLRGTPAVFSGSCGTVPPTECGLGQGGKIVRLADGTLLAAFFGFAADGPTTCKPGYAWARCYTLAMYRSSDEGLHWDYTSRIDHTPVMPTAVEGPCEPTLCLLNDGRVLLVFRLQSGFALWQSYSSDGGVHWTKPAASSAWAVWPQLLLLSNGVLLLSSGRPGLGLWVSHDGSGASWDDSYNIASEHNRHFPPPSPLAFSPLSANITSRTSPDSNPAQTTSYTSLVEIAPNVAHLAYDLLRVGCPLGKTEKWCQQHGLGYDGGTDNVFAMQIEVQKTDRTENTTRPPSQRLKSDDSDGATEVAGLTCTKDEACGWSFPGPNLTPCDTPLAGEGMNIEPQKGQLPGCGASCSGLIPLDQCEQACQANDQCTAVTWHAATKECYLKSNPTACGIVASGKFCPWNNDRDQHNGWQYHMHCPCSIGGVFTNKTPKVSGCGSAWGWTIIIALTLGAALYGGGGLGYSYKVHGGELTHPHRQQWTAFGGLVVDGARFVTVKAKALAGSDELTRDDNGLLANAAPLPAAGGSDGGDDDAIVE